MDTISVITPLRAIEGLSTPPLVPAATMTLGSHSSTQQFLELAAEADSLRLAQLLVQVSDAGDAHDRLSPLLHLVGASDSVRTLATWAAADVRLQHWASLSAHLWHSDELMRQFPKVYDTNQVREDFYGEMPQRYLAAMAASRLPEGQNNNLLTWLRTLKLWLLMRAVDAAEAGYVFEPSVRSACDEIRLACENKHEDKRRVPWLNAMVGDSSPTDLEEFQRHLASASDHVKANGKSLPRGQRDLAIALARVVEGRWKEDTLAHAQPLWQGELAPWPTRATPEPSTDGAPPPDHGDEGDDEDDADGDPRDSAQVDPASTPASQSAKATSVLLVNQAEGHMLAWDWHSLILDERFALVDLVDSLVQPNKPLVERLGGALMAVALLTSSSARRIPRLKTGRTPANDWKVDVPRGLLHRLPARRDRRWKAPQGASAIAKWVRPLTNPWELGLADPVAAALQEAMPSRGRSLRAAWQAVRPQETFEHWVNTLLSETPGLARLTSPSLARAQRHCAFESLQDHALARLVSSCSKTVLPSPCSYSAYTGRSVQGVLGPPFARLATWVTAASFAEANGAGSEMDIDSARIKVALASLRKRIEVAARQNNWAKHHNLLTSLCVIGLLGCTGARPVSSPFQSLAWFNFETGLVYVDDKSAGAQRGSRLCILAPEVTELVRDCYLPHLKTLGRALANSLPDIGRAIDEVLQESPSARMPLFFFVKAAPEFDWTEVSEISLTRECGDDWPLPWNFSRHRLATRLRRVGLDAEIIDALLGHGEAGSESHGAQSLRVLGDDLERARSKVEDLTLELDLRPPAPWSVTEIHFAHLPTRPLLDESRSYGSAARRLRRDAAHEQAATVAVVEIQRLLDRRPPDSLSGDEWEAIGRQMLLRKDGLPQAFASIRYAAFEKYLNQLWHEHGVRPRMRRRYTLPVPTRPVVSELALRGKDLVAELRVAFEAVVARLDGAPPAAKLALALAAIDICLAGCVADASLLAALVQRPNVVPVLHQGRWFIEVFEGLHWTDGMPLRRFAVPARAIEWLLLGGEERRRAVKPRPIPGELAAFAARLAGAPAQTLPALLKQLSRVVDQFNVVTLSGFEAAVLAGRVKVSALPHGDLVRSGEARALLRVASAKPETATALDDASIGDGWDGPGVPAGRTPEGCRALMKAIGGVLSSATERGSKAVEIEALLKHSPFVNGDLPHALGRWIVHVLGRDAKTHAGALKLPTVERYFDALASKVSAVGHATHLVDMDGDELTDLYYDLLQAPYFGSVARKRKQRTKGAKPAAPDKKAEVDGGGDGYAADRLVEFHDFAQGLFGLDDPDWSELGEFSDRPSGRPGLITTAEYLASVTSLVGPRGHRETATHLLECAWVLLLGFRFGLRGGEGVGLDRADWIERAGAIVVLVRPNSTRGLKTVRGKRVVPLIETLTDLEKSVIDEILRRFEERPREVRRQALVSDLQAGNFKYRRMQITGRLLRLVKQATLNPGAIVHHARHSFANRIFALLAGRAFGLGSEGRFDATQCEAARRLLLGRLTLDRRALWALCRLMGHSSPATLIRCYLHLQVLPAAQRVDPYGVTRRARAGYIDIDGLARSPDYLKNLPEAAQQASATLPAPSLDMLFNYLRLRRIGRPAVSAAYVVGLEPVFAARLEAALSACAPRLEKVHASDQPLRSSADLIGSVGLARYRSLIDAARSVTIDADIPLEPFEQFESTVGRSRQIVLFEVSHFASMAGFVKHLRLTKKDLVFLQPKVLSAGLRQQIVHHEFERFAAKVKPGGTPSPQIDTAIVHLRGKLSPTVYPLRVAMKILGDKGRFATGYELVIGWCCYCLLRLATPGSGESS